MELAIDVDNMWINIDSIENGLVVLLCRCQSWMVHVHTKGMLVTKRDHPRKQLNVCLDLLLFVHVHTLLLDHRVWHRLIKNVHSIIDEVPMLLLEIHGLLDNPGTMLHVRATSFGRSEGSPGICRSWF